MSTEIKSCIRCNNKATLKERDNIIWVQCDSCITFSKPSFNIILAIEIWNDSVEDTLYGDGSKLKK